MAVRVLRLLEYTYIDAQDMERDMSHWQMPAQGIHRVGNGGLIRSALITAFDYDTEEEIKYGAPSTDQPG